jgi:hydrogenase maturation protease
MTGRVLVAGVGNIFLGDDGFGVAVANRLAGADLPNWVQVADYGISGMHLAYDLADGYETAILVDTARRGEAPGTLTVIEEGRRERLRQHGAAGAASCDGTVAGDPAGPAGALAQTRLFDAHGMQPDVVLGVLDMLGASSARVLVVGCEPASLDYGMELSEPVAKAVDAAVQIVMDLIAASADEKAIPADTNGEGAPHVPRHTR